MKQDTFQIYRLKGRQRRQVRRFIATSGRLTKLVESNIKNHVWSLDYDGQVTLWDLNNQSVAERYDAGLAGSATLALCRCQRTMAVSMGRTIWTANRR